MSKSEVSAAKQPPTPVKWRGLWACIVDGRCLGIGKTPEEAIADWRETIAKDTWSAQ